MPRRVLALFLLAACSSAPPAPEGPPPELARSADGLAVAYEARGAGDPALVFVHGWGGRRDEWREVMDGLAPRFRVVALDLGGHGDSGRERARWTLESLADDVVAVLDALDLRGSVLVGHSMGGPVCLLAAARAPERVAGVIGVETLEQVEYADPPGLADALAASLRDDRRGAMERYVRAAMPLEVDPELADRLIEAALASDLEASIALLAAYSEFDPRPALRDCPVPVRCINSAETIETDAESARKYAPGFEVVLLHRSGHFPMVEAPPELAHWIAEFASRMHGASQR